MNSYPECDSLPTERKRQICRNEAGLPLDGKHSVNAYRQAWGLPPLDIIRSEPPAGSSGNISNSTPAKPAGVGTELKRLLAKLGIKPQRGCGCDGFANKMDVWGVQGCQEHRSEIIEHLRARYAESTTWTKAVAFGNAIFQGIPMTLDGLLDEAIQRASSV